MSGRQVSAGMEVSDMTQAVFGESIQGAAHMRSKTPCQDSKRKIEYKDKTVIMAAADGHGSASSPYSKTGANIAVNVFCTLMSSLYESYSSDPEALLNYLNREGDTKVAAKIDTEWKRRINKVHTASKREVSFTEKGKKNKEEIYKKYGTTLVGLMITPLFIFAFKIGDGNIIYLDNHEAKELIEGDKILGIETHSLSKSASWKNALTLTRRFDFTANRPYLFMLSTDGFLNSYTNEQEYLKSCRNYFSVLKEYGSEAVASSLKAWLTETSELGCGDDITLMLAYYTL